VAELVRGGIDVAALIRATSRPDCGALAVFLGTTRDHHRGRKVARLEYEAYEPMARAALEGLEREAVARFAVASCRIVHRLGEVPLAEASVVVAVAAAHRGPAFEACRWAMDELKARVPIWKKERYEGGGEDWVEGTRLRGGPGASEGSMRDPP
jgi:molybdopterin synthase catalytic subunit